MGSCFSKSDKEPVGTANKRFTRSEQKLGGNNESGTAGNENKIIDEKHKDSTKRYEQNSNSLAQGKTLGGEESDRKNPNTREAVAKAAELRYNKQRQLLKESQDKLKVMSRKSKQEKGLQTIEQEAKHILSILHMKAFFNSNTSRNSFFKQEQERIESIIKEPLLEYVLQDLPHLQATKEQQDDVWEMIAIKLNTDQFQSVLASTDNSNKDVDEIATLNGPYIKEVYFKLMDVFIQRVYSINRYKQVYKAEYTRSPDGGPAPIGYAAFSLPIREILTERTDKILCELFYLKGYDVEVMAKLSKERFEEQQRSEYKKKVSAVSNSNQDLDKETRHDTSIYNDKEKTHRALEQIKEQLGKLKLEFYEKEFTKKNKKLDQLNKENKLLLELNHELVMELQRLRELS